jgi:hypothetical protein
MHNKLWKFVCMRVSSGLLIGLAVAMNVVAPLPATTLQQLTLEDMTQKSTAIVRARVTGSRSSSRGSDVYTHFQLQVLETWKSSGHAPTEVAVPGGVFNGIRQSVAGAPELKPGQEYVLFLWTGRSGLTQVIGLSQGVFKLSEESSGGGVAQRPAASELMLNPSGLPVENRPVSIPLQDLRSRVMTVLGPALGAAR